MAFWDQASVEPKRNFRYRVKFGSDFPGNLALFAQKVKKPSYKIEPKEYQFLNHKFKYPSRVSWENSSIEFVDAGGSPGMQDVTATLMALINRAGYVVPKSSSDLTSISKKRITDAIGDVTVDVLNAEGQPIETWVMKNAMFLDVTWPDLSYETDEISKISVTVAYDYALLSDLSKSPTQSGVWPDPSILPKPTDY